MSKNNKENNVVDFERNITEDEFEDSGSFIKMDGFDEPSKI